jgi:predicted Na+-dependent transporter
MTPNPIVILTRQSGGDAASAVINSTFANFVGVFISPALIFLYINQ